MKLQHQWASCQISKIVGVHAPGMPGTFSPPSRVSDSDMHLGTCVTHVPWCMPGSLTSGFLWIRRRGETFPTFPVHAHPQFYLSGKRPIASYAPLNHYSDVIMSAMASHIIGVSIVYPIVSICFHLMASSCDNNKHSGYGLNTYQINDSPGACRSDP